MGHKVGWIPLYSAVAGGADVCLIPEIPYEMDSVIAAIDRRMQSGARFTIIVVAEGAISREEAALSKKEYKKRVAARTSPSIAYDIAREVEARCGRETRVAVPGHTQRGGQPEAQDRVFATQCGVEAALGCLEGEYGFMVAQRDGEMRRVPLAEVAGKLTRVDPAGDLVRLEGEYGFMVAQRDGEMRRVPLAEVAGKLKYVDPASDLVREARALGISFGDEA